MGKKALFMAVIFISTVSTAQKLHYRGYHYGAYLAGEEEGYQVLTTHGIEKDAWFFGLGTGFDSYRKSSIPAFATVSRYLFPSRKDFFLSLNAGTSFALKKDFNALVGATSVLYQPRPFGEAGIGYRLQLKTMRPGQGVLFGAYYSYKELRAKYTLPGSCNNPPCADRYEYVNYEFNRWAFKMGFTL